MPSPSTAATKARPESQFPKLWGDIPARPFLPIDKAGNPAPAARDTVLRILQDHLRGRT